MALTPRQQLFVAEYLVDLNATAAYKRAGYTATGRSAENNASRLMGNAGVAAAIAAGLDGRKERVGVTSDMVVAGLLTEARRDGEGSSHAARVAAWGHLGKHLGMFVDRHSIETPGVLILGGVDRAACLGQPQQPQ